MLAVDGLSLNVADGECIVLVGPSGCGKSTTLRMLAGLEEVSHGEILIDGRPVNHLPPQKRNAAMVFQNYALYPHKTVRENLAFPLRMMKLPKTERDKRIARVPTANHIRVRVVSIEALGHENIVYFESPALMYGQEAAIDAAENGKKPSTARTAARLPAAGSPPATGEVFTLGVDTKKLAFFDPQGRSLLSAK